MLQQSLEKINQEIVAYILQNRNTQSRFEIDRALLHQYYLPHEIEHSWQIVNEIHQVEPNPGIVSYIRWRESTLTRPLIEKNLLESGYSLYDIEVAWKAVENNWQPKGEGRSTRKQAPHWLRHTFLAANSLTILLTLASFFFPWTGDSGFYYVRDAIFYYDVVTYSTAFGLSPYTFLLFGILLVILGLNVADRLIPSLATRSATWLSVVHFILLSSVILGFFKIVHLTNLHFHGTGQSLFGYGLFFAIVSNGWSIKNEGFRLWSVLRYFLVLFLFIPVLIIAVLYFFPHNWAD